MLTVLLLFSFVISEILKEDFVKHGSEDEREGLAALFFEHERKPAVRICGFVEEVVANLSDDCFKRNFRLSSLQRASRLNLSRNQTRK